jgi:hypothetical protein
MCRNVGVVINTSIRRGSRVQIALAKVRILFHGAGFIHQAKIFQISSGVVLMENK